MTKTFHGAFISTGNHNGFYTLRHMTAGDGFAKETFIQNLGRDWDEVYTKFQDHCRRTNRVSMTHKDSQWDLNEWGAGGTSDWSVSRYMEWKAIFATGVMPFGKHRGQPLDSLTANYRNWLRKFAAEKGAEGKFQKRTWDLVIEALMPFLGNDAEAELAEKQAKEAREAQRAEIAANSKHVGEVGKRMVVRLKMVARFSYESKNTFEMVSVKKFLDENNNVFVAYGNCPIAEVSENFYTVKCTPKRHGEFKGEKQTVINRLALV